MKNPTPRILAVVPYQMNDPYVVSCVAHLQTFTDDIYFHCDKTGAMMADEGWWRRSMLEKAVEVLDPVDGVDWLLVNDSDEFLASPNKMLANNLRFAMESSADAFLFGRDELWKLTPAMKRVDKTWGAITNLRMFRYRANMPMNIADKRLACGSTPEWSHRNVLDISRQVRVVHAGYVLWTDRRARYDRYVGLPGHGTGHVGSILDTQPVLEAVNYAPDIWRNS